MRSGFRELYSISRRQMRAATFSLPLAASLCFAADPRDSELKALYDTHQWFRLRDAVQGAEAPLFYQAAVACAFNDSERCEQQLQRFLESAPSSAEACEAHGLLSDLYCRTGRFRLALAEQEKAVALGGEEQDRQNTRAMLRAFSRHPELSVVQSRVSTLHVWYKNAFVPVTINGRRFKCFLDTGANLSVVSESAARRLGLAVSEVSGTKFGDSTGTGFNLKQVAVADRLTLGNIQLSHVPFIVVSDRSQPFADWSSGKRCILGIQVLLACQTVRWRSGLVGATLQLGAPPGPRNIRDANLCFDGMMPLAAAGFGQHPLELELDTGAGWSALDPLFFKEFPQFVNSAGKRGTRTFEGLGGTAKAETMILPQLTLRLGGFDTTFRPIDVYLSGAGSRWYHGLLGGNFLTKAREVTFDFDAMTFTLR